MCRSVKLPLNIDFHLCKTASSYISFSIIPLKKNRKTGKRIQLFYVFREYLYIFRDKVFPETIGNTFAGNPE